MTGYLVAGISGLALLATVFAGIQSVRLTGTLADLKTVRTDLADARTDRDRIARDRARAVGVMTKERDRAVAAEQLAAELKVQIAKDAGTARDASTAPVLKDTILGIQKSAWSGDGSSIVFGPPSSLTPPRPRFVVERQDALFNGRRPVVWRLFVIRDGSVITMATYAKRQDCVDAAKARAIESIVLPLPDSIKIHCALSRPGEKA